MIDKSHIAQTQAGFDRSFAMHGRSLVATPASIITEVVQETVLS